MQLNWFTFLLEVVNFLVLVWILKRFLYKPVLAAIARRKAAIDRTLSDAQAKREEAQALETQYQHRLSDWEEQKEGLRTALAKDLRAQRELLTAGLQKTIEQERERERVLAERRLAESEDRAAEQGIMKGIRFTAKLLQRVASPELEARLLVLVLEDLPQLPPAQVEALQEACRDPQRAVKIATAFPLAEAQRSQVVRALRVATHENVTVVFEQDSSLMAGLRISAGPWSVLANLCDELQFFAEMVKQDVRQE